MGEHGGFIFKNLAHKTFLQRFLSWNLSACISPLSNSSIIDIMLYSRKGAYIRSNANIDFFYRKKRIIGAKSHASCGYNIHSPSYTASLNTHQDRYWAVSYRSDCILPMFYKLLQSKPIDTYIIRLFIERLFKGQTRGEMFAFGS